MAEISAVFIVSLARISHRSRRTCHKMKITKRVSRSLFVDGVQLGSVGAPADFGAAVEVADPFGHKVPVHAPCAVALSFTPHAKLVGMIDYCLDAQYAPMFGVHFDPVAFLSGVSRGRRASVC